MSSPDDSLKHSPRREDDENSDEQSIDALREQFVSLLTAEQLALHRYIFTLLGDHDAASNVLQETNLVLGRKIDEFQFGTSFGAWASKVAYFQTLAYIRDAKRDRHVFGEALVEQLAARPVLDVDASEARIALRHCLRELSEKNFELIQQRYNCDLEIEALAERLGKRPGAVKVQLHRIRRSLLECIQKRLAWN